jgi:hypothetical protein
VIDSKAFVIRVLHLPIFSLSLVCLLMGEVDGLQLYQAFFSGVMTKELIRETKQGVYRNAANFTESQSNPFKGETAGSG